MPRRMTLLMLLCAVGAMLAPAGRATIVRSFTLASLTLESDAIVRGTVVGQEVVYDETWRRVYTHTLVEVEEVLAGHDRVGDVVVVRQLGGELDGILSMVVGNAPLPLGQEVLLFARSDGAFHYLVGMAQGGYQVDRSVPGEARIRRSMRGLMRMPLPAISRGVAPDRTTLAGMRRAVGAILAEAGRW